MSDNAVFMKRLRRTLVTARSLEVCSEQAVASFDAYRGQLYRQLDIDPATRPTTSAKMVADCTLNDLRQRILKAEIETLEPWRTILTAVRGRVDMARRVLATHMAEDDAATAPLIGAYEWPGCSVVRAVALHRLLPDGAGRGSQHPERNDQPPPTLRDATRSSAR